MAANTASDGSDVDGKPVPGSVADITPEWLTAVLRADGALTAGRVTSIAPELIGKGLGFGSSLVRLDVAYADADGAAPQTLIAKLPSRDPKIRAMGQLWDRFEREILFYQRLAGRCAMQTPRCYYADMQSSSGEGTHSGSRRRAQRLPRWLKALLLKVAVNIFRFRKRPYLLLLENLENARPGSQLDGAGLEDATIAARDLAVMHAQFWGRRDIEKHDWLPQRIGPPRQLRAEYESNAERFFRKLAFSPPPHIKPLMLRAHRHIETIHAKLVRPPYTLLHGDFRLDNIYFRGGRIVAIDWELTSRGRGIMDLAWFVMGNLRSEVDDAGELQVLKKYHDALLENGVTQYDFDTCDRDYRMAKILTAFIMMSASKEHDAGSGEYDSLMQCWYRRLLRRLPENQFERLFD